MQSSHEFIVFDITEPVEKPKVVLNKYEIWLGKYHLGQGYDPPESPKKIAEIEAISFEVACLKYELQISLESIQRQEQNGYVDMQSRIWWYNEKTNSNGWTGKYYQSEDEAWESFGGKENYLAQLVQRKASENIPWNQIKITMMHNPALDNLKTT
jgi:hypothetical protein